MDVYIHIGYPKTGSTAIQSHVFTNRGWLMKRGIYIPEAGYAGGFGHGHLLPTSFTAPINFGEKPGPTELESLVSELSTAEANGFEKCLLTWEGFTDKSEGELKPLGEALRDHRVIVLAYVREHAELFQSIVLQDLEQLRFERGQLLFDRANMFEQMGPKFDYHHLLKIWQTTFQLHGQIRTRLYQRARLLEGNVVVDFLQWLGLEVDDHFCLQSRSVNPSLDCRAAGMLVATQAADLEPVLLQPLIKALLAVIADEGAQSKKFLSSQEVNEIGDFYSESSGRLFSEFRPENLEEGENGFPLAAPSLDKQEGQSDFEWLQHVYQAMHNPRIPLWQGNVLTSYNLGKIVSLPSTGWRGPEKLGIWSVGGRSELRFLIPEVDSSQGPKAINLILAGHYFGKNKTTKLIIGNRESVADLSRAELRIEIDAEVQGNGICVGLEHEYPTLAEEEGVDPSVHGLAFKLQFLSYDFIWE